MNFWSSVVFSSAGDIDRERYMGNLEYLLVAPTPFWGTMLAKILGNTCLGLASLCLTAFYVGVACGVPLEAPHPAALAMALVLVTGSFVAVAMMMSGVFTLSRNAWGLMNGLEYPVFLVSGFLFPVEALPAWVRPLSYAMLPTWAVKALRCSLESAPLGAEFWLSVAVMCTLGAAYWTVAVVLYKLIERRVRVAG
ncbi:MAG: ABC transporter permease [Acetobacteraceae bacterium]|nr:ABC transporter permease [Acetobacteraceae bacterium]